MFQYEIVPAVDAVREFLEISSDFTNPLEVVREAISNSIDAEANHIEILFTRPKEAGKSILLIEITDDGNGMDEATFQSFFDLGNSLKRGETSMIGEKGHGTKVYFNCSSFQVETVQNGRRLKATMDQPFTRLHDGKLPTVMVEASDASNEASGTKISIRGFNDNNGEPFSHARLRDYVLWFSKFGSWENIIGLTCHSAKRLVLKGLDRKEPETLSFGHFFPDESASVDKLFETHLVRAPDHFCKRIVKKGNLRRRPEVEYEAVFVIEGNKVKQSYNAMLRRQGYAAPPGAYTVQERYGIWLCKDFMPIERKNEWISSKGSEYTKFHAFLNCQELSLTANRGSVANTDTVVLEDIKEVVKQIYEDILSGDEWRAIDWLEEQASAYVTAEKEAKDFKWRQQRVGISNIAFLDKTILVEPKRESGVYALLIQLSVLHPELFPFEIIDYDTHSGIDVIAKHRDSVPVANSTLYYVELKYFLSSNMNHSFDNIRYIVCWDIEIKHGGVASDISGQERTLHIVPADPNAGGYTGYFLRRDFKQEIEVFVLKDYLKAKLGIDFRPRTVAMIAAS